MRKVTIHFPDMVEVYEFNKELDAWTCGGRVVARNLENFRTFVADMIAEGIEVEVEQ